MFIGRYYHTIETKGRLAIPQTFRSQLKLGSVITRGLDGCLFLFPASSWKKLSNTLASLPLTNPSARNFIRLLVQNAAPVEFDAQGRTLIPPFLRDQAKLKKQVVVAGALTRLEIWDADSYHEHLELLEKDQSLEANLSELGI